MDITHKVSPELRQVFAQLPEFRLPEDLEKARNNPMPAFVKSADVNVIERTIQGADGHEMLVKMYAPADRDRSRLPALLWIHGGGYVMGHPGYDDNLCQEFARTAGCVVVSPDYRLAPEHPYPAGLEDCYSALKWITEAAGELAIDPSRIAIGGASAGGGLTAALVLLARDRGGPAVCFQMPLYPMIDDRNLTVSSHEITDAKVWNRQNNLAAWKLYLGEHAATEISPYAAPSRAMNLEGLPPLYTCVGQLDPFRDETIEYVARLARAGIDTEFHLYPGCYHGFEHADPHAEISKRARSGYVNALARALQHG